MIYTRHILLPVRIGTFHHTVYHVAETFLRAGNKRGIHKMVNFNATVIRYLYGIFQADVVEKNIVDA